MYHPLAAPLWRHVTVSDPLQWSPGALTGSNVVIDTPVVTLPAAARRPVGRAALDVLAQLGGLGASVLLGYLLAGVLDAEQGRREGMAPLIVLFASVELALLVERSRARPTRRILPTAGTGFMRTSEAVAAGAIVAALFAPLVARNPNPFIVTGHALVWSLPALLVLPVLERVTHRFDTPSRERVVIVGSGAVADAVARRLGLHRSIELIGAVDDDPLGPVIGGLSDLAQLCTTHRVGRVIVAFSRTPSARSVEELRRLDPTVRISVVPRMFELLGWSAQVEEFDGLPLVHVPRPQLTLLGRAVKRAMDLAVATAVLACCAPLMVFLAACIKADSPGPVFFRQARTGVGGHTFRIFKFRTMTQNAESLRASLAEASEVDGPIFKIHRDPRVTGVGRWLRRTSLDELPQFLNVILGDMSLVGPRPFPVAEAEQIAGWPVPRTSVRPGITGLWQVSGRNDLTFDDLKQLDTLYVTSWSIWSDVRIILRTPGSVLRRTGAY